MNTFEDFTNEWFLVGIKLKAQQLKKIPSPIYLFSATEGFTCLPLQLAIWVIYRFLSCIKTLEFLRILRATSSLLIVLASKKDIIGYWQAFRPFEDNGPTNSLGVRICRGHLQVIREFEIFQFISLHWVGNIFVPSPL